MASSAAVPVSWRWALGVQRFDWALDLDPLAPEQSAYWEVFLPLPSRLLLLGMDMR